MDQSIRKISFSRDQLKIFAYIVMFIDHAAYGLIYHYLQFNMINIDPDTYTRLNDIYEMLRHIGRLSAPVFMFFLVEGFFHTKSVLKYAVRLGIMALFSEVFFDLGLYHETVYLDHQNVMFTLFLGLFTIWGIDRAIKITGMSPVLKGVLVIAITASAMDIASIIKCDYQWHGILTIVIIYLLHEIRPVSLLAGAASFAWEKYAPISFLIMYFYDDSKKPNPKLKAISYLIYPAHLLLIYLIGLALGL